MCKIILKPILVKKISHIDIKYLLLLHNTTFKVLYYVSVSLWRFTDNIVDKSGTTHKIGSCRDCIGKLIRRKYAKRD